MLEIFIEGFCWSNVLTTYIKCRKKDKTIHSTESMTFFSMTKNTPEYYLISIINSSLVAKYVDSFINSTSHFTTGDAKLVPIVIPTETELKEFKRIYDNAINIKTREFEGSISEQDAEHQLYLLQDKLDKYTIQLYGL